MKELPLKHLSFAYNAAIPDLRPLAKLNLEVIRISLPLPPESMAALRKMGSLKIIDASHAGRFTREVFWKRYDAGKLPK